MSRRSAVTTAGSLRRSVSSPPSISRSTFILSPSSVSCEANVPCGAGRRGSAGLGVMDGQKTSWGRVGWGVPHLRPVQEPRCHLARLVAVVVDGLGRIAGKEEAELGPDCQGPLTGPGGTPWGVGDRTPLDSIEAGALPAGLALQPTKGLSTPELSLSLFCALLCDFSGVPQDPPQCWPASDQDSVLQKPPPPHPSPVP